jgi:3-hydroxymyristoyl/3-hydroxydecanoyl-(acyl carrier protein) dehydratase
MTRFVIAGDHPALPGHFPGRPIVPGVVVLDRVLEAIEAAHGPLGALRLPQVKFLRPLLPGEPAQVAIEPVQSAQPGAAALRWRFRVERAGELIASGEVAAA